jgi:acetyl/propionyl-CoA carboxylase alpha subunit
MEITRHYDPLLAKIVACGSTREEAIARMSAALRETIVTGVPTTIPFHRWAMAHPKFRAGVYDTGFVESAWAARQAPEAWMAALAAAVLVHRDAGRPPLLPSQPPMAWAQTARLEGIS